MILLSIGDLSPMRNYKLFLLSSFSHQDSGRPYAYHASVDPSSFPIHEQSCIPGLPYVTYRPYQQGALP
jgi:hypothetical protein